jgi:hypothetical protein
MSGSRKLAIQPFAEVLWHLKLERHAIADQAHQIARTVVDCGAVFAILEVRFDSGAQLWAEISFKIIGDLAPGFFAADFDNRLSVSTRLPWPHLLVLTPRAPASIDSGRKRVAHMQARAQQTRPDVLL